MGVGNGSKMVRAEMTVMAGHSHAVFQMNNPCSNFDLVKIMSH